MALARQSIWFDEILDFLASTPTPSAILAFSPSEALQARASQLLELNRQGILTETERAELNELGEIQQFMILLKAKARQKLAS